MGIRDIGKVRKDDILAALGLETMPPTSSWLLSTIGIFALGVAVGAGAALVLAPSSGSDLRRQLAHRLRSKEKPGDGQALEGGG
jgi:hypothetical protein